MMFFSLSTSAKNATTRNTIIIIIGEGSKKQMDRVNPFSSSRSGSTFPVVGSACKKASHAEITNHEEFFLSSVPRLKVCKWKERKKIHNWGKSVKARCGKKDEKNVEWVHLAVIFTPLHFTNRRRPRFLTRSTSTVGVQLPQLGRLSLTSHFEWCEKGDDGERRERKKYPNRFPEREFVACPFSFSFFFRPRLTTR